jgi:hypothetical protein
MKLVDQDIDWHDGNLVDVHVNGLAAKAQDVRLYLDLYPADDDGQERKRFCCVGKNLRRFLVSGDVARLGRNSKSGNIDFMRMEFTDDSEILILSLFGGVIEAEAAQFQMAEVKK